MINLEFAEEFMKILIINCSPVRNGATAEIVNIVKDNLSTENEVRSICIDAIKQHNAFKKMML